MPTELVPNLFAYRLRQARTMRAWSLQALVDALDGLVTKATLSKYENGAMRPSPDVLSALVGALGVDEDFFERPVRVQLGKVEFRKRSSLLKSEEMALREHAADFFERYAELEEFFGIGAKFQNPLRDTVIKDAEMVESAVVELRDAWKLGHAPIQSVLALLESQHLMIYAEKASEKFDGFCGRAGGRDLIALNSAFTTDRRRFTALHELGHVVLRFDPKFSEKEQHSLCMRFAGAMLMPRPIFPEAFGGHRQKVTAAELIRLKARYGISCAAIMRRAQDLDLMAPSTMERFWTSWNARGYRRNDPGPCPFPEKPERFAALLDRAVAEGRITIAKAASLAAQPEEEFRAALEIFP